MVYDSTTLVSTNVRAEFRLAPKPELFISATNNAVLRHALAGKDVTQVRFPLRSTTISVMESMVSGTEVEVIPNSHPVTGRRQPRKRLHRVTFHLLNFPHCWGTSVTYKSSSTTSHRLYQNTFQAGGWVITVSSLPTTPDALKILKKNHGYAVTHIGTIEKAKGKTFSIAEAGRRNDLCAALFLLFAPWGVVCAYSNFWIR